MYLRFKWVSKLASKSTFFFFIQWQQPLKRIVGFTILLPFHDLLWEKEFFISFLIPYPSMKMTYDSKVLRIILNSGKSMRRMKERRKLWFLIYDAANLLFQCISNPVYKRLIYFCCVNSLWRFVYGMS